MIEAYSQFLIDQGINPQYLDFIYNLTAIVAMLILGYLARKISGIFFTRLAPKIIHKTNNTWDTLIKKRKVLSTLDWLTGFITILLLSRFIESAVLAIVIRKVTLTLIIINFLVALQRFLLCVNDIYNLNVDNKTVSIKAYIQLIIIILYFIGIVSIIGILINQSPLSLFAGLGAFAAVLMFIFKDSMLGLVASIQLSANNMIQVGDWISIPSKGIDGNVMEMNLTNVTIQNWDKTINSIPTYYFVSENFTNWKGMEESGGRRIKRCVHLDISTIKFLEKEDIERLFKIEILYDYLKFKYDKYYSEESVLNIANHKRLTNVGLFRKYLEFYLKKHPHINSEMTFMIRQLQSTEKGLPIEVYMFSYQKEWIKFEAVQSDIFDHIFAILEQFGLSVLQFKIDQH